MLKLAHTKAHQRGAVLIVGLVMLAVMTLLVVSMIKTSVVELKIGGASQIAQQNCNLIDRITFKPEAHCVCTKFRHLVKSVVSWSRSCRTVLPCVGDVDESTRRSVQYMNHQTCAS